MHPVKNLFVRLTDGLLHLLGEMARYFVRKRTPVTFNDLRRNKPLSSMFGLERGTAIDRYYIEKFLQKNKQFIRGRTLEVGDSYYSRKFGAGSAESFEVLHTVPENGSATLIGDLTEKATLPENAFDCFICTQTFNFIFEAGKAVQGAHHLLKPGGILLATVSGISQISRYDMNRWGDYWRFTTASTRKLFSEVFGDGVEVDSSGNVLAAVAFLQGVAVEDLPDRTLLDDNDPDYQVVITIIARKAS